MTIVALHTVVALTIATLALPWLFNGAAALVWASGFYGEGDVSAAWVLGRGVGQIGLAGAEVLCALLWFAGAIRPGILLVALTAVLLPVSSWPVALLLVVAGILVSLDLMVLHHHRSRAGH